MRFCSDNYLNKSFTYKLFNNFNLIEEIIINFHRVKAEIVSETVICRSAKKKKKKKQMILMMIKMMQLRSLYFVVKHTHLILFTHVRAKGIKCIYDKLGLSPNTPRF